MDRFMREDMELAAASPAVEWEKLAGSTVLVTGATGLIGRQVVLALLCANRVRALSLRVIAVVRNVEKAKKLFLEFSGDAALRFHVWDANEPFCLDEAVDYIVHGASVTDSKMFVDKPVETIWTVLCGSRSMLAFAREKAVKGMVFLSTMEVYGTPDSSLASITEKDYGYLNPSEVRSSYPEAKRLTECLCASYAKEYGVCVTTARLTQTFGPGVAYTDNRVFAQFARCVLEKKDIVLKTEGTTVRNYLYTREAVISLLVLLTKGKPGEAYNVANPDIVLSIREMAQMVADNFTEAGIRVTFSIDEDASALGYAPPFVMRLNTDKLAALGYRPTMGLQEMYERMIASMQETV